MWRGSDKYLQVVGHFRSLVSRVCVLLSILLLRFSQIVVTFKHDIISSSHFTIYVDWFRFSLTLQELNLIQRVTKVKFFTP